MSDHAKKDRRSAERDKKPRRRRSKKPADEAPASTWFRSPIDRLREKIGGRFRLGSCAQDPVEKTPWTDRIENESARLAISLLRSMARSLFSLLSKSPGPTAVLASCALVGLLGDWPRIAWELAWAFLSLATCLILARKTERPFRFLFALLTAGFIYLSGIGAATRPLLGMVGFAAWHALVLGVYARSLWRVFRKAAIENVIDKQFQKTGIWLLNIGLCGFVFFWVRESMPAGWQMQSVLAGFREGLFALSMVAFFTVLLEVRGEHAVRDLLGPVLIGALVLLALCAARSGRIGFDLWVAQRAVTEKRAPEAMASLDRAVAGNRTLGWSPFDLKAKTIRRDICFIPRQHDLELKSAGERILARRAKTIPEQYREALEQYLSPQPLTPIYEETSTWASADQVGFVSTLHALVYREPGDEALLLPLFLQNGRLDRLEERYAWNGFPEIANLDSLELALLRYLRGQPSDSLEAEYFLAILHFRTGEYEESLQGFRRVLDKKPDNHNALVYMRRLAERSAETQPLAAGIPKARERRVPLGTFHGANAPSIPPHGVTEPSPEDRAILRIDDLAWAAFEANPARYSVEIDARARPFRAQWPVLAVFLGSRAEPVFQGQIEWETWKPVRFEQEFDAQSVHRLLLVSEEAWVNAGKNKEPILEIGAVRIRVLN